MLSNARLRILRDGTDALLARMPVQKRRVVRESPYGRRVRIVKQHVQGDPKVGSFGLVLSEEDHGIEHHSGFTTMTPKFPGIRGYHYLVRLDGDAAAQPLSHAMFECV